MNLPHLTAEQRAEIERLADLMKTVTGENSRIRLELSYVANPGTMTVIEDGVETHTRQPNMRFVFALKDADWGDGLPELVERQ